MSHSAVSCGHFLISARGNASTTCRQGVPFDVDDAVCFQGYVKHFVDRLSLPKLGEANWNRDF
jgi:hypothetical protein